jgi:branched-subunit amino acid transport protein
VSLGSFAAKPKSTIHYSRFSIFYFLVMIWFTIFGMAFVTFLTRVVPMLAMRGEIAPWIRRWLSFVPVAVFTALALPPLLVLRTEVGAQLSFGTPLLAGLVGAIVAWYTRSALATMLAGLAVYWLLRMVGS